MVNWKKYGYVIASEYRTKIVLSLDKNPKTPSQITKESGFYASHVSNTLSDLEKMKIVECLTPELRKGKIFTLTTDGKEIANTISNMKK